MRQQRLAEQAADAARSEQRAGERLDEVGPTIEKWWRQDVERFERRSAEAGDYVW